MRPELPLDGAGFDLWALDGQRATCLCCSAVLDLGAGIPAALHSRTCPVPAIGCAPTAERRQDALAAAVYLRDARSAPVPTHAQLALAAFALAGSVSHAWALVTYPLEPATC